MGENDSKELWLKLEQDIRPEELRLGHYTTQAYMDDPCALTFITARYKFCSKMLEGKSSILEIGCGDGFGGVLVAQKVGHLLCCDINEDMIEDNRERMGRFKNIDYLYHDFRRNSLVDDFDGAYLIDVIEHIYASEEEKFMGNIVQSLNEYGICLIGTPNKTADVYASEYSRQGHVNLKDYQDMRELGEKYFHNYFIFGMNDEIVHTGFPQMAHFLWLMGIGPRNQST